MPLFPFLRSEFCYLTYNGVDFCLCDILRGKELPSRTFGVGRIRGEFRYQLLTLRDWIREHRGKIGEDLNLRANHWRAGDA